MTVEPAPGGRSLIGETVGSYRITREIARGGMGVVYEAVHDQLGQRAAVKVLSEELAIDPNYKDFVGRFFDEARAITAIQHPGIVKIQDFGQMPTGTVFILMEFLEGEPLYDRVWRYWSEHGRGLPIPDAMRFTRQIASAVAAAHKKSILHRDLKLANVLLVPDPEAPGAERTKLIDFGIARFLDSPHRRTTVGTILGTPQYMSPEQCHGQDVDHKSDVYALGIMLYEMLAGQPPFDGAMATVIIQHITEAPPELRERLPDTPDHVHYLVHSMLAKDPQQRPTMAQVVSRIQQWEAEAPLRSAPQPLLEGDDTRVMVEKIPATPSIVGAVAPASQRARPEQPVTRIVPPRPEPARLPRLVLAGAAGAGVMLLSLLLFWLLSRR